MTTQYTRAQLLQAPQGRAKLSVRRVGLAGDIEPAHLTPGTVLFTITGGPVEIHSLFGLITTVIGAGAAVPQLAFKPAVGAISDLCAAAADISTLPAETLFTWTGLLAGLLTPCVGLGHLDLTGAEAGFVSPLTIVPGTINLINAVGGTTGVIDWYITYLPIGATSLIVATP